MGNSLKEASKSPADMKVPLWLKIATIISYAVALIFLLWATVESSNQYANAKQFETMGWGEYGRIIVINRVNALWHAALMAVVISVLCTLLVRRLINERFLKYIVAYGIPILVVVDVYLLSKHYIKMMPKDSLKENEVITLLRTAMPHKRVALVTQSDFYNFWLTYLFPYYNIKCFNVPQMPRMPTDYKRFLQTISSNPVRLWQLSAVEFVLGPAEIWQYFQSQPVMSNAFELVYAYNVAPSGMTVNVLPSSHEMPGRHAVFKMRLPSPRYALLSRWEKVSDDYALRLLGDTNFVLFSKALLANDATSEYVPECNIRGDGASITGAIDVVFYKAGYVKLKVNSDVPTILRFAEKYDPNWKVTVGDVEKKLLRVDYIFQGVYLEPGINKVVFSYQPRVRLLIVFQILSFVFIAIAISSLMRSWIRQKNKEATLQS